MDDSREPLPRLADGERIVTAFATPNAGPGWSNSPVTVVIASSAGEMRLDYLQSYHLSKVMDTMYSVSCIAHICMSTQAFKLMSRE